MNKKALISELRSHHQAFGIYVESLAEQDFCFAKPTKWTAGQQLKHIILSINPLTQGFILPKFVLKLLFGKANRPSKTYQDLIEKYKLKLENGGVATGTFIPKPVSFETRQRLINQLNKKVSILASQIETFSETDLDLIILPHPLLGKITVREMCYFTIYHVQHHQQLIQMALADNQKS